MNTVQLVSVHIPKTAGTAFRTILDEIYGEGLLLDYGDQYSFMDVVKPGFVLRSRRLWKKIRRGAYLQDKTNARCVHGHFRATKYRDSFPEAKFAVWLRDPVDRLVSHYYHWKRIPDYNHTLCRMVNEESLSLVDFAELEVMRNLFLRYLDGMSVSQFDFVGIQERYEEDIKGFYEMVGVAPRGPVRRVNENALRPRELDGKVRKHLRRLNSLDYELYSALL